MKSRWMLVKALLGVLILVFLVSFSAQRHACKPLKDISVSIDHINGQYFVNDSLVRKIVNGNKFNVSKTPLGNMDVAVLEETLNRNSFVRKSEVFQEIDGILKVKIQQEIPIARINTGNDEYYLSEKLTKMPLSSLHSAKVLLVGGDIKEKDFQALKDFADSISADKLLKKHIIALEKEKPNSFNLFVNNGDYVIEFGELNNFSEKFEKLKLFYDQYLGKVGLNYYEKINLRFNNQIVATKRNNDEK